MKNLIRADRAAALYKLPLGVVAVIFMIIGISSAWRTAPPDAYKAVQAALGQGDLIRLHVIANSDEDADQALKYKVRDALLGAFADKLAANTPEEAAETIVALLQDIKAVAIETVRINGYDDYLVNVSFGDEAFPTRQYAGLIIPAGVYPSLVVRIGSASGRNWWCVMYPPLCLISPDTLDAASAAVRTVETVEAAPVYSKAMPPIIARKVAATFGKPELGNAWEGRFLTRRYAQSGGRSEGLFHSSIINWIMSIL
ncbi:hypothetical protein FACS18948_0190 [Clostridia bacterium]|nr:hypothetical protein FACS18948_0190 [Clostridia bacterium]